MSTNSTITVRTADNERKTIYCHWDGYPSNNGAILLMYYNELNKAIALVNGGDLSALRPRIAPNKNEVHSFSNSVEDVCVYYGRDRGETGVEAKVLTNGQSIDKQEYNYYFDGEKWFVNNKVLTRKMCELPE